MSIRSNAVLLLKSEKTDGETDKYQQILQQHKFEVILVKTLAFHFQNLQLLRDKLQNPNNYSGLILSSPRCVEAVAQSLEKHEIESNWKNKSNFTVGETTHQHAINKLGVECRGKETGNAINLSQLIIDDKTKFDKPFLFPHGNLKTDTLQIELNRVNIELDSVLVYETLANDQLESELAEATDDFSQIPEFVVFFSPSGFNSSIDLLKRVPIDLNTVKFIAIGPVTQTAIETSNLPVWKTAASPTPEQVLNAIKHN